MNYSNKYMPKYRFTAIYYEVAKATLKNDF